MILGLFQVKGILLSLHPLNVAPRATQSSLDESRTDMTVSGRHRYYTYKHKICSQSVFHSIAEMVWRDAASFA